MLVCVCLLMLHVGGTALGAIGRHRVVAASTFQLDAAHDGYAPERIRPPLRLRWSRDLGGQVSYAVIARGRVFAVVVGRTYRLVALSARTGRVVWSHVITSPGAFEVDPPAYDSGRVFVGDSFSTPSATFTRVEAYSANSGKLAWRTQPLAQNGGANPAYMMDAPLVARDGALFATAGGFGITVYALSERSGRQVWVRDLPAGDHSSPAVSRSRVFVSYPCQTGALNRRTGAIVWYRSIGCDGGGGRTPVLWDGWLWARDTGYNNGLGSDFEIRNAANGSLIRTEQANPVNDPPPAFAGHLAFKVHDGTLTAESWRSARRVWTLQGKQLTTAPIITRDIVYVGSQTGELYAASAHTGRVLWHANAGAPQTAPDKWNNSTVPGLSASGQTIIVAATNRLVAYQR